MIQHPQFSGKASVTHNSDKVQIYEQTDLIHCPQLYTQVFVNHSGDKAQICE